MLRHLTDGTDVCVTVTLLDGLVFARSAFHHSMNYRCVVLFGRATRVTDPDEMQTMAAAPPRPPRARPQRRRAATDRGRAPGDARSSGCPIDEGSAKVRTGGPIDDAEDLELPVWAGELPLRLVAQSPIPDPGAGDAPAVPAYIIGRVARP